MQMNDLVQPIDKMTDDELRERLRNLRHRRQVERPASKNIAKRAISKGKTTRINKLEALLSNMSETERQLLIAQLGADE